MNFLSGINKKLITYIVIGAGAIILLIIIMVIISSIKGSRITPEVLETRLETAAEKYFADYPEQLPQNNGEIKSISSTTLVNDGYIKAFDKLLQKNYTCNGEVTVQKNGEFYLYSPNLDCGEDYKTIKLVDKIKTDNPIVVNNDGLYQMGSDLVFKGEKINNYISFAGQTWLIMRINSDNTIRIIEQDIEYTDEYWDDRYNIQRESNTGINNFEVSRVKDGLRKIYYETESYTDLDKEKIVFKRLCIGKRSEEEFNNTGSVECSVLTEEEEPFGLIQVNEFMLASLDKNCVYSFDGQCENYNYLSVLQKGTWSITADADTTHKAYKFYGYGFDLSNCSNTTGLRLVTNLSSQINYVSGTGTIDDPYVVE